MSFKVSNGGAVRDWRDTAGALAVAARILSIFVVKCVANWLAVNGLDMFGDGGDMRTWTLDQSLRPSFLHESIVVIQYSRNLC